MEVTKWLKPSISVSQIGDSASVTTGKRPFYINLSQGVIGSPEALSSLAPIEDITMIGYPNGLWDEVNNLPIVRRGITATSANGKYQGKTEFLIDAACFPGSSGSPVFVYNNGSYGGFGGAGQQRQCRCQSPKFRTT